MQRALVVTKVLDQSHLWLRNQLSWVPRKALWVRFRLWERKVELNPMVLTSLRILIPTSQWLVRKPQVHYVRARGTLQLLATRPRVQVVKLNSRLTRLGLLNSVLSHNLKPWSSASSMMHMFFSMNSSTLSVIHRAVSNRSSITTN